jgi:chemotaxis signal transduction protein
MQAESSQPQAGEPSTSALRSLGGKYMTFQLAAEDYGVEILKVREIISIDGDFILGVGKAAHRVVFLLDVARVLSGTELTQIASAAKA